ncbi:MAG: hypothetical protein IT372_33180 [Polyangiaceae bacterium]|nr:hypothetical protein [Polyangiaceae bacterium]
MLTRLCDKLSYALLLGLLAGCTAPNPQLSGCSAGGLNTNQKAPGDQPGGVAVGMGDIAVAPSGEFVIFKRGDELAVGWPETGRVESLPVVSPTRLAFSKARPVVYVGSEQDSSVHAIDVESRAELWSAPVFDASGSALRVASTSDDARVVLSTWDQVVLLDSGTGEEITALSAGGTVIDLEILPDDARALVVPAHAWIDGAPSTRITVLTLEDGAARDFDVPNCSDDIVVPKDGARAFLAPTTCTQDPISTIDLTPGGEHFVRNLPGFGPLALGPDGVTAVGFLDAALADASLFDDPAQVPPLDPQSPYHLMVLDTRDLTYRFHPVGQEMPRYAITPDGSVLLVDTVPGKPVRLFDIESGTFRQVTGPSLLLDNFVLTSDSAHAYVVYAGLYDLDIDEAKAAQIPTEHAPLNINIAPDDRTLYLRESDTTVCVFSLATRRCGAYLTTESGEPPAI